MGARSFFPESGVEPEPEIRYQPRAVYLKASKGFFLICSQGSATPGVYARLKSRCVTHALVGLTSIFPGRAPE